MPSFHQVSTTRINSIPSRRHPSVVSKDEGGDVESPYRTGVLAPSALATRDATITTAATSSVSFFTGAVSFVSDDDGEDRNDGDDDDDETSLNSIPPPPPPCMLIDGAVDYIDGGCCGYDDASLEEVDESVYALLDVIDEDGRIGSNMTELTGRERNSLMDDNSLEASSLGEWGLSVVSEVVSDDGGESTDETSEDGTNIEDETWDARIIEYDDDSGYHVEEVYNELEGYKSKKRRGMVTTGPEASVASSLDRPDQREEDHRAKARRGRTAVPEGRPQRTERRSFDDVDQMPMPSFDDLDMLPQPSLDDLDEVLTAATSSLEQQASLDIVNDLSKYEEELLSNNETILSSDIDFPPPPPPPKYDASPSSFSPLAKSKLQLSKRIFVRKKEEQSLAGDGSEGGDKIVGMSTLPSESVRRAKAKMKDGLMSGATNSLRLARGLTKHGTFPMAMTPREELSQRSEPVNGSPSEGGGGARAKSGPLLGAINKGLPRGLAKTGMTPAALQEAPSDELSQHSEPVDFNPSEGGDREVRSSLPRVDSSQHSEPVRIEFEESEIETSTQIEEELTRPIVHDPSKEGRDEIQPLIKGHATTKTGLRSGVTNKGLKGSAKTSCTAPAAIKDMPRVDFSQHSESVRIESVESEIEMSTWTEEEPIQPIVNNPPRGEGDEIDPSLSSSSSSAENVGEGSARTRNGLRLGAINKGLSKGLTKITAPRQMPRTESGQHSEPLREESETEKSTDVGENLVQSHARKPLEESVSEIESPPSVHSSGSKNVRKGGAMTNKRLLFGTINRSLSKGLTKIGRGSATAKEVLHVESSQHSESVRIEPVESEIETSMEVEEKQMQSPSRIKLNPSEESTSEIESLSPSVHSTGSKNVREGGARFRFGTINKGLSKGLTKMSATSMTQKETPRVESIQESSHIEFEDSEIELSNDYDSISSPTTVAGVGSTLKDPDGKRNARKDQTPANHTMVPAAKEMPPVKSIRSNPRANPTTVPAAKEIMTRVESNYSIGVTDLSLQASFAYDADSLQSSYAKLYYNLVGHSVATKHSSVATKECSTLSGGPSFDESINAENFENHGVSRVVSQHRQQGLQPLGEISDGNHAEGSHEEQSSSNDKPSQKGKGDCLDSTASTETEDSTVRSNKSNIRGKSILKRLKKGKQRSPIIEGIASKLDKEKVTDYVRKENRVEDAVGTERVDSSAEESAAASTSNVKIAKSESGYNSKHWNVALDKNSSNLYYYNSKTNEVSWMKPPGFDDGKMKDVDKTPIVNHCENDGGVDVEYLGPLTASQDRQLVEDEGSTSKVENNSGKSSNRRILPEKDVDSCSAEIDNAGHKALRNLSGNPKSRKIAFHRKLKRGGSKKEHHAKRSAKVEVDFAKHWKIALDHSTLKRYYYNRKTKEVTWSKPPGFNEIKTDISENDDSRMNEVATAATGATLAAKKQKSPWFKSPKGKKAEARRAEKAVKEKMDEENVIALEPAARGGDPIAETQKVNTKAAIKSNVENDSAKCWRSALDATTGETYYYNKKTRAVSWTKPTD